VPYAQIDVSAPRHRKVWALSDAAFRLWVSGLCYCQEHLTDGVLHRNVVASLAPRVRPSVIATLVAVAIVVGAYSGANGYIEGHYATRRTAQPEP